jgi:hypothetical protein
MWTHFRICFYFAYKGLEGFIMALTQRQAYLLDELGRKGVVLLTTLTAAGVTGQTINSLDKRGLITSNIANLQNICGLTSRGKFLFATLYNLSKSDWDHRKEELTVFYERVSKGYNDSGIKLNKRRYNQ